MRTNQLRPITSFARLGVAVLAVAALVALLAAPASAHIEPDPAAVPAGATTTISFNVEHGCGESPTTKLEMQIPPGVTAPQGGGGALGWTVSATGSVVTWTGPAQAPHTPMMITVHATMPTTPGLIHFPIVQTCQQGTVQWIEVQQPGQPEPDNPAPTVQILAPGQAAPPTTVDADADAGSSATHATTAAHPSPSSPAKAPQHAKSKSSSHTGLVIGIVIAVIVVALAAVGAISRQRRSAR
ncbi:MAG: DUF1775 domain-containing protein [Acidimicrobiales bacterium]